MAEVPSWLVSRATELLQKGTWVVLDCHPSRCPDRVALSLQAGLVTASTTKAARHFQP